MHAYVFLFAKQQFTISVVSYLCLFELIFSVQGKHFSVMSGRLYGYSVLLKDPALL